MSGKQGPRHHHLSTQAQRTQDRRVWTPIFACASKISRASCPQKCLGWCPRLVEELPSRTEPRDVFDRLICVVLSIPVGGMPGRVISVGGEKEGMPRLAGLGEIQVWLPASPAFVPLGLLAFSLFQPQPALARQRQSPGRLPGATSVESVECPIFKARWRAGRLRIQLMAVNSNSSFSST